MHLIAIALLLAGTSASPAQVFGLDRHTVTIQVLPITTVQILGGGITLDMNNANVVAGQDVMSVTDQSTSVQWATNSASRKITVVTDLAAPLFGLQLRALNPTSGVAVTEVTLSTTARDLLLDIGRSTGSAALLYTAIAYASQGTGTDNHVITFTIQSQ
jgi:hypothetical protein